MAYYRRRYRRRYRPRARFARRPIGRRSFSSRGRVFNRLKGHTTGEDKSTLKKGILSYSGSDENSYGYMTYSNTKSGQSSEVDNPGYPGKCRMITSTTATYTSRVLSSVYNMKDMLYSLGLSTPMGLLYDKVSLVNIVMEFFVRKSSDTNYERGMLVAVIAPNNSCDSTPTFSDEFEDWRAIPGNQVVSLKEGSNFLNCPWRTFKEIGNESTVISPFGIPFEMTVDNEAPLYAPLVAIYNKSAVTTYQISLRIHVTFRFFQKHAFVNQIEAAP